MAVTWTCAFAALCTVAAPCQDDPRGAIFSAQIADDGASGVLQGDYVLPTPGSVIVQHGGTPARAPETFLSAPADLLTGSVALSIRARDGAAQLAIIDDVFGVPVIAGGSGYCLATERAAAPQKVAL